MSKYCLVFQYLLIEKMHGIEEVITSNPKEDLAEIQSRYVLYNMRGVETFHSCLIFDLLFSDLEKAQEKWAMEYYNRMIERHGKEVIDLFVLKDETIIQKKLVNIINFALDQVYKTDEIEIMVYKDPSSSLPDIIYSTLEMNFVITEQRLLSTTAGYFTIKKKESKNE